MKKSNFHISSVNCKVHSKFGETISYLIINYFLFFVVVSVFVFIVPGANDICDIPSDVDNNS